MNTSAIWFGMYGTGYRTTFPDTISEFPGLLEERALHAGPSKFSNRIRKGHDSIAEILRAIGGNAIEAAITSGCGKT